MLREFSRAVTTMGIEEESMNWKWDVFADIVYPAFLYVRGETGLGGGGMAENLLSFPLL